MNSPYDKYITEKAICQANSIQFVYLNGFFNTFRVSFLHES